MTLILVTAVLPVRAYATDEKRILHDYIQTKDGKTIEKVSYKDVEIKSIREGTKIIATVVLGDITHFIESDTIDPIFSITTGGKKIPYDRRDFLVEGGMSTQSINDPYFGSPYTNQLCGTKAIGAPHYTTAFAYESYDYFDYEHDWYRFAINTGIQIIIGVMAWFSPFKIITLS